MTEYIHSVTGEIKTERQILDPIRSTTSISKNTIAEMGYVPVLQAPAPAPSSPVKVVRRNGVTTDANGNKVQAWIEVDMFSDIDGGPTKAEQEAEYLASTLTSVRDGLWEQIKTIRDTKKLEGGYTTGGKWYHSDTFSRTQQLGLVMMGANVPAVQWKTMDGSFVAMTRTLAGQIFAAAAAQDSAMFTHAETLKAQVDASSDPASIDINAGWPSTYQ